MTADEVTFITLVLHRLWIRNNEGNCPLCERWAIDGCHSPKCRYREALRILEVEADKLADPIMV